MGDVFFDGASSCTRSSAAASLPRPAHNRARLSAGTLACQAGSAAAAVPRLLHVWSCGLWMPLRMQPGRRQERHEQAGRRRGIV